MQATKLKSQKPALKELLSAINKLSEEEKQLLRMQLFAGDALAEVKAFEAKLKMKKTLRKKSDEDIVKLTTSIRRKRYATSKKMLH